MTPNNAGRAARVQPSGTLVPMVLMVWLMAIVGCLVAVVVGLVIMKLLGLLD